MPIYDFVCPECHTSSERVLSSYSLTEIQVCPSCSSELQIQFPSPNIVRSGTLFDRSRIPKDFQQGVLEPIKKKYRSKNPRIDETIKI